MSETHVKIGVVVVAAILVVVTIRLRFYYDVELPPKPPKPETGDVVVEADSAAALPEAYVGYLEADANKYAVDVPTPDQIRARLRFQVHEIPKTLVPGTDDATMDAAGLRLTVAIRRAGRGDDLVLLIENRTDENVAYRIDTTPSVRANVCTSEKSSITHNALVIPAGETISRSECSYRRGWTLTVDRVETVALGPLQTHYINTLPARVTGLDPRFERDHLSPNSNDICSTVLPTTVQRGLETGAVAWRDIIDFFARHPCRVYRFPVEYKAFTEDGERQLPAIDE